MKPLRDRIPKADMDVVSATELRARLGECLTLAQAGIPVCIRRKSGPPVYLVDEAHANVTHVIGRDGKCPSSGHVAGGAKRPAPRRG